MSETMKEKWEDIPNTNGKLQVSDLGHVRYSLSTSKAVLSTSLKV